MRIFLLLGACLLSGAALAAEGSNFAVPYPDASCGAKPVKPVVPLTRSQAEINAYNEKAEAYNALATKYGACVSAYVEKANNDVELIRAKAQAALDATK